MKKSKINVVISIFFIINSLYITLCAYLFIKYFIYV